MPGTPATQAPLIRLVLTDIDGTLRPAASPQVPGRTLAAIDALREEGVSFGPATGRPMGDLRDIFGENGDRFLVNGVINGGKQVLWDGELIFERQVDHGELSRLCELVRDMDDALVIVHLEDPVGDLLGPDRGWAALPVDAERYKTLPQELRETFAATPLVEVPDDESVVCACLIHSGGPGRGAQLKAMAEEACPDFELVSPGPGLFDVNPRGWNKAGGLGVLLERTGIGLDQVAFMGDSDNDVTMMRAVPHSFCVAGGSPAALEAASAVIPSADDLGPARLMESLVRNHGRLVLEDVVA